MRKWVVIIILAVSQFVMILDSTVMNVSINTVATDLGTTISGMQAAITLYALTMAAFMLTGGKLGDIWGRHNAFRIGSVVYGIGSLITALSPTIGVLLFGWSFVEGLGAVLVIPAIAALAAVNYAGKDRVVAFSILGAVTGLAAAVGPIIGGLVTTYFSWRYVFAAETVVMVGVLLVAHKIHDEKVAKKPKLDIFSSVLSAVGMSLLVYGVLQSKTWGWVNPLHPPVIAGVEIAPLGISPVTYLIAAGLAVLWWFVRRQQQLAAAGKTPLLKVSMMAIASLRSGLISFLGQYFVIASLFFVVPVYLQVILGYDALATGIRLVPLSVGLILFSIVGLRLSKSRSARRITRVGQFAMAFGVLLVIGSINSELDDVLFSVGLFVVGGGFGLLASQLGNSNMSAVSKDETAEVGGLQGTFQNLGTSFGTAIAGSVFILLLTSGFTAAVQQSSSLSATTKQAITAGDTSSIPIVGQQQAEQLVIDNGGSAATAQQVAGLYEISQLQALRDSLFVVFLVALTTLFFSRGLPSRVT